MGRQKLAFLYPNTGKGDMAEGAWVRFVRRLPRNQALLGESADLHEFLFGSDPTALGAIRDLLREAAGSRCFYCAGASRGEPVVDTSTDAGGRYSPVSLLPFRLDDRQHLEA